MLSTNVIKHIHKLQQKKHRAEIGEFLVEGVKGVEEALKENAVVKMIFVEEIRREEEGIKEIIATAKSKKVEVQFMGRKDIGEIKTTDTYPGVTAIVEMRKIALPDILDGTPILCLDRVNDPGNLGTIIRTADWFGIKNLLLTDGTVDPYHEKVVRSTMGSIFRMKIVETGSIVETLKELKAKGYTLNALVLGGKALRLAATLAQGKDVYIFGSESHGVRKEVLELCDGKYTIPGGGEAESLNVGVAVGIVLHSIV